MTPFEEFITKLTALAGLTPFFVLSDWMLELYDRGLRDLGYPELSKALDHVFMTRTSKDPFPSVQEIRDIIQPRADPEDEASALAEKLAYAIQTDGSAIYAERARERLGEVAWEMIQESGGWEKFCTSVHDEKALPIVKSQWRKALKSKMVKDRNQMPEATEIEDQRDLKQLGVEMKSIGDGT